MEEQLPESFIEKIGILKLAGFFEMHTGSMEVHFDDAGKIKLIDKRSKIRVI